MMIPLIRRIHAANDTFSTLGLGPQLWLDAMDATTVDTVGKRWLDKSGNARHAQMGQYPSLTYSNNAITFDSQYYNVGMDIAGMPTTDYDLFYVATPKQPSNNFPMGYRMLFRASPGVDLFYSPRTTSTNWPPNTFYTGITGSGVVIGTWADNLARLGSLNVVAGAVKASWSGNPLSATLVTFAPANVALKAIGSDSGSGGSFWGGTVNEVLVYPTLSAANRQRVEGYLAWKWGLVASLPAGHPHKTQAP